MVVAACGEKPVAQDEPAQPPSPAATSAPVTPVANPATAPSAEHRFASWSGRWTGPEGLFVTITPTTPEHYSIQMRSDLDTSGTYEGRDDEHGIRFVRNGEALMLYRASGDDTGLKWLAGKRDCLMVKPGEGFCRG
jgi:hypothetical protein